MTRRMMIVVPPTVGHVNHGVALAHSLAEAGHAPVVVTGTKATEHVRWLRTSVPVRTFASHDFLTDRRSPHYRSHLEQLCDVEHLVAAVRDQVTVVDELAVDTIVTKDYFAAVLTAERASLPCLGYYTDGIESLVETTVRQTVQDADRLSEQVNTAATMLGLARRPRPVPDMLRSPTLNLVRGFPETALADAAAIESVDVPVAFVGAVTHDAPADELQRTIESIAGLPRPLTYVTFGTVLRDHGRIDTVARAARQLPGTVLLALGGAPAPTDPPANLVTTRYMPNSAALSVSDVLVHHGGHGTMLTALLAGATQVVAPDNPRTNQRHHGAALEGLGVGRLLDELTPDRLVEAVLALREPQPREAAAKLSRQLGKRSVSLQAQAWDRLAAVG
ncbi:hypothetical protein BH10ACT10_BH10ACT10_02140 [soil metagenome]